MTAAWVDQVLRKWDVSRLPNDARLIATHLRRGDTSSRVRIEGCAYNRSDAGRPIVDCIYVAGYASNGQYHTGLTDQRGPAEQRSATQRALIDDSNQIADLSALHTPLPQATLGAYVDSSRSMPTPYGLVSTSQNLVEHQLTQTQPNQVIWYSLGPKNVNDFLNFVRD
jgi:hypothetical protein